MDKKTILVTGASSGIGKATAEKLITEGHTVYVAARRIEKMKELEAKGAIPIKMDLTNEEEIQACADLIIDKSGGLDVLVNNAGYAIYGAVENITIDEARRQFEVNIFGLASITKRFLPYMREKKSGTIINISSMGGKMYTPLGAWYHATKHALEGWSDCLRLELSPFGIDVVIIEPGIIETEFVDVMYQPMIDSAKGGPYEKFTNLIANASKKSYEPGKASPPSIIANTISKAVNDPKPKTRYVAGKMAKMLMFIRKYFGDRIFDKAVMSQVK
jgi:short-subunit dehydrogenase